MWVILPILKQMSNQMATSESRCTGYKLSSQKRCLFFRNPQLTLVVVRSTYVKPITIKGITVDRNSISRECIHEIVNPNGRSLGTFQDIFLKDIDAHTSLKMVYRFFLKSMNPLVLSCSRTQNLSLFPFCM